MKKFAMITSLMVIFFFGIFMPCMAEEELEENAENEKKIFMLDKMEVTAPKSEENIVVTPSATTIKIENYKSPVIPQNIVDVLKDRAIIDFRGQSDLVPEENDVYMRGFDPRQFVTAIDGLSVEKTGGYWGDHFVDFSLIPMAQIESIELIPGPHSALYSGRSLGGVVDVKTKTPQKHETPETDFKVSGSYRSYNTQNHTVNIDGGVNSFDYGVSYQKYHTDGYLRNTDANIDTISARLGYILPSDGYISFSTSYSDKETGQPVPNDPTRDDYDPDYPVVKTSDASSRWRDPARQPERFKEPYSYRLNIRQPTPIGSWKLGGYYTYEDQEFDFKDVETPQAATCYTSWGGNIQDEIKLFDVHLVTIGFDTAQLSSQHTRKIVESYAGFIQDKWRIIPRLSLTAGVRYENINIWWSNTRSGKYVNPNIPEDYVKRDYKQYVPKSFLTYELDDLANGFRDTSLSMGVSKIWTPRSFCEVCSWGSGIEVDPMYGIGYDLVFERRIWKNIHLNVDFSHYEINDYPVSADTSSDYYKESPWGETGWGRRKVSLEEVHKDGVELEINGDILKNLGFYASYAYNEWKYKGPYNGGPEEIADERMSDRAKHRINAGLRYNLFEKTRFLLDYKYQDKQVMEVVDVIDEDAGIWEVREVRIDNYNLFDFSLEQTVFKEWGGVRDAILRLYVNNLFDEEYQTSRGYPATDRTYGVALSFKF